MYLAQLPALQAERQLLAIEAASVPHLKPEDARRITQRHVQRVQAGTGQRPRSASEALLESGGFQVIREPAKR